MKPIDLFIVVAMTPNGLIGNQGKLPWEKLPSDMARFVQITKEVGVVVMGRKTWESIPEKFRPLTERINIILTRQVGYEAIGATVVNSLKKACEEVAVVGGRACIIGGTGIYKLFLSLPQVTMAYITIVHAPELHGNVYFPKIDESWKRIRESAIRKWNPNDEYPTSFAVYERKQR